MMSNCSAQNIKIEIEFRFYKFPLGQKLTFYPKIAKNFMCEKYEFSGKLRLQKCEFCEKLRFQKCEFCEK